jgi:hypothetical protein
MSIEKYNILWLKEIRRVGLCPKSLPFVAYSYNPKGLFEQMAILPKKEGLSPC